MHTHFKFGLKEKCKIQEQKRVKKRNGRSILPQEMPRSDGRVIQTSLREFGVKRVRTEAVWGGVFIGM